MAKMLVVDGSLIHRTTVREILRGADHTVCEAADAQAGLVKAIAEEPDLVLLGDDLNGPGRQELLDHLKGRQPELPVIVLADEAQDAPATGEIVPRMVEPEDLLPAIERLLPLALSR